MKNFAFYFIGVCLVLLVGLLTLGTLAPSVPKVGSANPTLGERVSAFADVIELGGRKGLSQVKNGSKVLADNLVRFKRVDIEGAYRIESANLLDAVGLSQFPFVWQLSLSEMENEIQKHPWIDRAEIQWKLFPLRLKINVQEAEPWIVAEYQGHSWLVSRKHELLVTLEEIRDPDTILLVSELPHISGLDDGEAFSSYLSSENLRLLYVCKMITFLELADAIPFAVNRYILQFDGSLELIPLESQRYPRVRLTANSFEDADGDRLKLAAVLKDLRLREEAVSLIDLRFEGQAIVR